MGGTTFKLKFGHRGANHPVKELETGKVEITSQNHGFAVDPASLPADVEVTHVNLYDGTVEGLRHETKPVFCVQYHPEASPGPHDADYLFRQFLDVMENADRVRREGAGAHSRSIPNAQTHRSQAHPRHRLRPDRHRPGVRVRLLGHAGLQGAARRRPRGHPRQQQPGDDHDRPGAGRPHVRRAADAGDPRQDHRARAARRAAADRRRPDRAQPRRGARRERHAREVRRRADRRVDRGDQGRRGSAAVQGRDARDRPRRAGERRGPTLGRSDRARADARLSRSSSGRRSRWAASAAASPTTSRSSASWPSAASS